ncbi:hypothetical protein [Methanococcus voltae]|uniref:Uncharacterized protein n=1 Tax=Methanococcus voltae (strain ATCC BAA-1334 / A3) TaxID=456320 RepID=D7DTF4_METV3|nr:hypothetical protein [Methanococcus voltae]MCS3901266.1 hypothetical protein [Methanococcus voltae]
MVRKDKCKALFLLFLLFLITINVVNAYNLDITAPEDLQIERGSYEDISIKIYLPNSFPVANDVNVSVKVVNCSETLYSTVLNAMGCDKETKYNEYFTISPNVRNIYQIMPGSSGFAYFKIYTKGNTPKRTYTLEITSNYMMVNKDKDAEGTADEYIYNVQTQNFDIEIIDGKGNIEVINDITPLILNDLNSMSNMSNMQNVSVSDTDNTKTTSCILNSNVNPNINIYIDGKLINGDSFNKTLNEGIHFIGIDGIGINHTDKRTIQVFAGTNEKIYLSKFFEDHLKKYAYENGLTTIYDNKYNITSNNTIGTNLEKSNDNTANNGDSSSTILDAESIMIGTVADKEVKVYMTPERYYLLIAVLILFAGVLLTVIIVNLLKSKKEEKDD